MAVIFNFKEKKGENEPCLLILYYSFQCRRYKYSTGISIEPRYWNPKTHRVISTAACSRDINLKLSSMAGDAMAIAYKFDNLNSDLSNETFIEELNKIYKPWRTAEAKKVLKENSKSNRIIPELERWSMDLKKHCGYNAVKAKIVLVPRLIEFIGNDQYFTFEDVKPKFCEDFRRFLTIEKRYAPNYVASIIKNLRTFLRDTHHIHKNDCYKDLKHKYEEADSISLTKAELDLLAKIELPSNLGNVRDCFLIQCYTALRYIDIKSLCLEDIQDGMLVKITAKTNKEIAVPIHNVVKEIIEKHNGFPKVISNQKMNEYLKDISRMAGLNRTVIITKTKGVTKIKNKYRVWELVTSHTGRRTALTLMYLDGIDLLSLIKISGHTTIKQLQTYLRVGVRESATNLKNHKFFI